MTKGERLKSLRKKKNWNQGELAKIVGISLNTISNIERDESDISGELAIKLSKLFNVSTDYLLQGKEETSSISDTEQEIIETLRKDGELLTALKQLIEVKKKVISFVIHQRIERLKHAA